MKLKRNEIAAIKRVAATVQPYLKKKDKINGQIKELENEKAKLDDAIHVWEQGIRNLTGFGIEELVERETVNGQTRFIVKEDLLEIEEEPVTEEVQEEPSTPTPIVEEQSEQPQSVLDSIF